MKERTLVDSWISKLDGICISWRYEGDKINEHRTLMQKYESWCGMKYEEIWLGAVVICERVKTVFIHFILQYTQAWGNQSTVWCYKQIHYRIVVDAVINNMVEQHTMGNGSAGNYYDADTYSFPPYDDPYFFSSTCPSSNGMNSSSDSNSSSSRRGKSDISSILEANICVSLCAICKKAWQ